MRQQQGFTLVELMVVVVIVAILAVIAYPMYKSYVYRAACEEGKAGVLEVAALLHDSYLRYGDYSHDVDVSKNGVFSLMKSIPNNSSNPDFTVYVGVGEDAKSGFSVKAQVEEGGRLSALGTNSYISISGAGAKTSSINGIDVWEKGCEAL